MHNPKTPQQVIDENMQTVAHRVMDVFDKADEDALAEEIMPDIFLAIGLLEAFGVAGSIDTDPKENR